MRERENEMGRVGAGSSCVTTTKNDLSESEIGDGDNRRSRDHQTSFFSLFFFVVAMS